MGQPALEWQVIMTLETERAKKLPKGVLIGHAKDFFEHALDILSKRGFLPETPPETYSTSFEFGGYKYALAFKRDPTKDSLYLHRKGIQQDLNVEEIFLSLDYNGEPTAEFSSQDLLKGRGIKDASLCYYFTSKITEFPTDRYENDQIAIDEIQYILHSF